MDETQGYQLEYCTYDTVAWHRGRFVNARLHYHSWWERGLRVNRLLALEELEVAQEPAVGGRPSLSREANLSYQSPIPKV